MLGIEQNNWMALQWRRQQLVWILSTSRKDLWCYLEQTKKEYNYYDD